MSQIKVIVNGVLGRMGQQAANAVAVEAGLELIGGADIKATRDHLVTPANNKAVPLYPDIDSLIESCRPDVLVDFSVAEAAVASAKLALKNGIHIVVGTTGLSDADLKEIDELAKVNSKGAVVAANFAIGAIVLMYLAKIASKYFDNAEIIELHHDKKLDAPSGTALATARAMLKGKERPFICPPTEKETLKGTRGGQTEGISIHSVRLPGLVASQEVIFGALGQTLSLRHDTISRESFMPGVILAIKEVVKRQGLVYGLDTLLNLGD
ncbi:MAG: 4-hydroxy-tetrahydrodipicolinate reductase [Chloroflexi bacterium]|nr:4-hydroxy-tetrahydrodipicolinate reductase [Chloroflexota bacterium]